METRELNISIPEGFEIDKEKSTFEHIIFKPIEQKRWRDNPENAISGYWIEDNSIIHYIKDNPNVPNNYNVFATEKQAKSTLAMARISQIMANDERFGGVVTDREWYSGPFYAIYRQEKLISISEFFTYFFLAFHTKQQAKLFLEENEDLVKQYLML